MLAKMIVLNANHGPDETDFHYRRIKDAVTQHFETCTPTTSPIFQSLVGRIAAERGDAIQQEDDESIENAVWRHCKEYNRCRPKGYKAKTSRYCAIVHDIRDLLPAWSQREFECSVAAVELNMITGKTLKKIKLKADVVEGACGAELPKAAAKPTKLEDNKSIRSSGGNAVVLSLSLLSEPTHRLVCEIMVAATIPTMLFSADACRELKDHVRSEAWLIRQNEGGTFEHIFETFRALQDEDLLVKLGFSSSKPTAMVAKVGGLFYCQRECHGKM